MGILKEFREFAVRGNVIDLAIGVVIGTAFGKIVSSLVGDIISPVLGRLVGGVSFVDLQVSLGQAPNGGPEVVLRWGSFLQTIFDFSIIALALFVAIKALNRLRAMAERTSPASAETPPVATEPAETVKLLGEIRDLLKERAAGR